jgi:transglutaminase-like putative cysteine protease
MTDGQTPSALPDANLDETALATMTLLDPGSVDWPRVERTAYLVHQHLRYQYPGPIHDLEQRLMILPVSQYGDQRRVIHRFEVAGSQYDQSEQLDEFGNMVISLRMPHVAEYVDFQAWIVVERQPALGPLRLPVAVRTDARFREPSPLTAADDALCRVAGELRSAGLEGLALAERIGEVTYGALRYEYGVTGIHTTAAEAFSSGRGVCQDYAHIMIALCRLCGLSARYVSGHLLGVGGTHAWVEVLVPSDNDPEVAIAWPYDPSSGCRVDLRYLTIAAGRDYWDVAPTSGTFRAAFPGRLEARKSVGITSASYRATGQRA